MYEGRSSVKNTALPLNPRKKEKNRINYYINLNTKKKRKTTFNVKKKVQYIV